MAIDVLSPVAGPQAQTRSWIDEALFLAFLLLAFVGLSPFQNGEALASETALVVQTGAGDSLRQVCYLAVLGLIVWRAWQRRGPQIIAVLPPVLMVLLVWCLGSAVWSPDPAVSFRRAGLEGVLILSVLFSLDALPARRNLDLWRAVLVLVLLVNLVSLKLVPAAVHPPGEVDPQLVGNWRGLYGHKNIAGAVAAITILLHLFRPERRFWQRLADFLVLLLAVVFLLGTHSKSSLGLLAVAVLSGFVYGIAWRREMDRTIALVALALGLVLLTVTALANETAIMRLLDDPTQFTGRTAIWQAEIAYIADHPIFGSGFGSFAGTGKTSPLTPYVASWVTGAQHGHNGFLQLLVTVGGVGFGLAMLALILLPLKDFWQRSGREIKTGLFALFVFLVLHNLMETDFLESDGVTWVSFLIVLGLLGALNREEATAGEIA